MTNIRSLRSLKPGPDPLDGHAGLAARAALASGELSLSDARLIHSNEERAQEAVSELDALLPEPSGAFSPTSLARAALILGAALPIARANPASPPAFLSAALSLWALRLGRLSPAEACESELLRAPSDALPPLLLRSLRAQAWSPSPACALFAAALGYANYYASEALVFTLSAPSPAADDPSIALPQSRGPRATPRSIDPGAEELDFFEAPRALPLSQAAPALYRSLFPQCPATTLLFMGPEQDLGQEPSREAIGLRLRAFALEFHARWLEPEPVAWAERAAALRQELLRELSDPSRLASCSETLCALVARLARARPPANARLNAAAAACCALSLALCSQMGCRPAKAWTLLAVSQRRGSPLWIGALARHWAIAFASRPDFLYESSLAPLFQKARRLGAFELTSIPSSNTAHAAPESPVA